MTDKQIKIAIVYDSSKPPIGMTPEETYRYEAFSALWDRLIHEFINDEDLEVVIPKKLDS